MTRIPALARLLVMAAGFAAGGASGAEPPNFERGRLLYDNHCQVCHTPKVHRRTPRLALSRDGLRAIVMMWMREENLRWSEQEVEDVVHYLNLTRYHY